MTNPSAPETRTDAPEAKDPAAPDGAAKGAGDKHASPSAQGTHGTQSFQSSQLEHTVVSLASVPPPPALVAAPTPAPAPVVAAAPTPTPTPASRRTRADV